jgi:hypothetical protein
MLKRVIHSKQKKLEDSRRILTYMRLFTRSKTGADPASLDELKDACPPFFDADDWQESLIYTYFAVNYQEEDLYHWLLARAGNFERHEKLNQLLAQPDSFVKLTNTNFSAKFSARLDLDQLAFDAALQRDYVDAAQHFIRTQENLNLSWANVKLMLESRREELVKECIKNNVRFEHTDA